MSLPSLIDKMVEAKFLVIGDRLRMSFSDAGSTVSPLSIDPLVIQKIERDYFWNSDILSVDDMHADICAISGEILSISYSKAIETNTGGDKLALTSYLYKLIPIYDGNQETSLKDAVTVIVRPGIGDSTNVITALFSDITVNWNKRITGFNLYRATGFNGVYYKQIEISCLGEDDANLTLAENTLVGQASLFCAGANVQTLAVNYWIIIGNKKHRILVITTNKIITLEIVGVSDVFPDIGYNGEYYAITDDSFSPVDHGGFQLSDDGWIISWNIDPSEYGYRARWYIETAESIDLSGFGGQTKTNGEFDEYVLRAVMLEVNWDGVRIEKPYSLEASTTYYFQIFMYAKDLPSTVDPDLAWRVQIKIEDPADDIYIGESGTAIDDDDYRPSSDDWEVPAGQVVKLSGYFTTSSSGSYPTSVTIKVNIYQFGGNHTADSEFYFDNHILTKAEFQSDGFNGMGGDNIIMSEDWDFGEDDKKYSRVILGTNADGNNGADSQIFRVDGNTTQALRLKNIPPAAIQGIDIKSYLGDFYLWKGISGTNDVQLTIYDDVMTDLTAHPTLETIIKTNYEIPIYHQGRLHGFDIVLDPDGEAEAHPNWGIFSEFEQPDVLTVSNTNIFEDTEGGKVLAGASLNDFIILWKRLAVFVMYMNPVDPSAREMQESSNKGIINPHALCRTPIGIFYMSHDGVYLVHPDGTLMRSPLSFPIQNRYDNFLVKEQASCGWYPERRKVFFALNGGLCEGVEIFALDIDSIGGQGIPVWTSFVWGGHPTSLNPHLPDD